LVVVTRRRWTGGRCPLRHKVDNSTSLDDGTDSMSVPSDLITASQQQPVLVAVSAPPSPPHRVSVSLHVSLAIPPSLPPSVCSSVSPSVCVPAEQASFRASSPPAAATSVLTVVQLGIAAGGRSVGVGDSPTHAPHRNRARSRRAIEPSGPELIMRR